MKNKKIQILAWLFALILACTTMAGCANNAGAPAQQSSSASQSASAEPTSAPEPSVTAEPSSQPSSSSEETQPADTPSDENLYEDVFANWNEDAPALNLLVDYVESVTDESSADFIPVGNRIAVFDMDGTLCAELFPTYLEYYAFAWRALKDPSYQADDETKERVKAVAEEIRQGGLTHTYKSDMAVRHAQAAASAYAGMTMTEFADFVTEILLRDADGFTGMTINESIYLPMIDVIEYLTDNDFLVYICSGSDRYLCRTLFEGTSDVPDEQIIGMDVALEASGQGDADGLDYDFQTSDELIRTDTMLVKNLKMNKVTAIAKEIGKQPVLSFGNTSGDTSMNLYTITNNPYKSAAFMLIADDDERDYGHPEKADALREQWEGYGFNVISMKNDFKTIYGDQVQKTGSFRWYDELAPEAIDYLVLVNKDHPLPDGWEDNLDLVRFTNTIENDIRVQREAYGAYLKLRDALAEENIIIDIENAYRSVDEQQQLIDDLAEQYGEEYAEQQLAAPGTSEHHTGLALNLYLIIDGENVVEEEDMAEYSEIWSQIHEQLADYGFILRYPEGKEDITGFSYKPWHIRYVGVDAAKEINEQGITLEEYEGAVEPTPTPTPEPTPSPEPTPEPSPSPEPVITGGWEVFEDGTGSLPEDAQDAFDAAMETYTGVELEPIALLGTQVVSGVNYMILCSGEPVVQDPHPQLFVATIYADPKGNASVSNVADFDLDDLEENGESADPQSPASPKTGSWSIPEEPEEVALPEDAATAFSAATDSLMGVKYLPAGLLGTKVISGEEYAFLAHATPVTSDPVPYYTVMFIAANADGSYELLRTASLNLTDYAG